MVLPACTSSRSRDQEQRGRSSPRNRSPVRRTECGRRDWHLRNGPDSVCIDAHLWFCQNGRGKFLRSRGHLCPCRESRVRAQRKRPRKGPSMGCVRLDRRAQRGRLLTGATRFLYFTLKSGKEDTCRNEWNDLKAVAGTGQGVGFGGRYVSNGRVRKAGEKAE